MMQEETDKQNTIRVIICRPGERAEAAEIEENLKSMQAIVGGLIQEYFPFHSDDDSRYDDVAIICNDEGKLMHMEPCRAIIYEDGSGRDDVIVGPFFICYAPIESETFLSMPEDLEKEFQKKFEMPEMFFQTEKGIVSMKYEPEPRAPERAQTR